LGDKWFIALCLEGLAGAHAQGQPARAIQLLAAAAALRDSIRAPLPPAYRAITDRHLTAAHARLGEAVFAAAWAEGKAMPIEQVIAMELAKGIPA